LNSSIKLAKDKLKPGLATRTLQEEGKNKKIAYLTHRDATYALSQFGTWQADACCLPLATSSTKSEIEYFIRDSRADLVLCNPEFKPMFSTLSSHMDSAPEVIEITHADILSEDMATQSKTEKPLGDID
jgi:long-subunit acyl-CoA synthetase (AMP-forming)